MKIMPSFLSNCFKSAPIAQRSQQNSSEEKIQVVINNSGVIFTPRVGSPIQLFSENLLQFVQNPENSTDDKIRMISNEMHESSFSWCGGSPLSVLSSGIEGYSTHLETILMAGANPNKSILSSRGHKEKPLHKASYMASVADVKILLKYGADPSLKDDLGRRAIEVSAELTGNRTIKRQLKKLLS
ncbi:MAG: hypothetical protein ACI9YB_002904 [Halioglobus sp.]|jgi:hypothetical protein